MIIWIIWIIWWFPESWGVYYPLYIRDSNHPTGESRSKPATIQRNDRGTPVHHPFIDSIFHEINHPAILGYPHDYANPQLSSVQNPSIIPLYALVDRDSPMELFNPQYIG